MWAYVQGTCSEDIQVNFFGMQKFTRFYWKFAYYGLISDFSTSSWFLFCEVDFAISSLISVFWPGCTRFHWVSDPSEKSDLAMQKYMYAS